MPACVFDLDTVTFHPWNDESHWGVARWRPFRRLTGAGHPVQTSSGSSIEDAIPPADPERAVGRDRRLRRLAEPSKAFSVVDA
jgi:hypothetical protein